MNLHTVASMLLGQIDTSISLDHLAGAGVGSLVGSFIGGAVGSFSAVRKKWDAETKAEVGSIMDDRILRHELACPLRSRPTPDRPVTA